MDKTTIIVIASVGGLLLVVIVVAIVLSLTATKKHNNQNNSDAGSCCALTYENSDGDSLTACEYQPFRDNAGDSVSQTYANAPSFADACNGAGGSVILNDASGVACSCYCDGASKTMASFVTAQGEYVESLSNDSPYIITN